MNKIINIGVTDLSFHHLTASLVSNVLIQMGFKINRIYSSHKENFEKLKSGEIDLLCSAWLPSSHGLYKNDVEKNVPLLTLGLHYEPYTLWGVPDYIPFKNVSEITDLLKPEVHQKMNKNIQGINAEAGITRFSIKMMKEYRLDKAGYTFHTGTEKQCFDAFENAVSRKEWVILPLWKPQFLHYQYTIRELKEPKGLLGTVDKAVLLLRQDRQHLFTKEEITKLDSLRFSNDIISNLDYKVSREEKNIDKTTKKWLNKSLFKF
ncbi:glycine betaine ABC transporter substrate-binding protein [Tenacibaculum dicentrarchi]|uniref:glycine betaine ABC transporter substrate-binding protein n=1 Tax=Tenacibaculum dicentrarchi TaxID=669041 RepID=UPI000C7C1EF1|nr:Glycine/betaine ABC transporter [Tenacibaculum dicentrarchi]